MDPSGYGPVFPSLSLFLSFPTEPRSCSSTRKWAIPVPPYLTDNKARPSTRLRHRSWMSSATETWSWLQIGVAVFLLSTWWEHEIDKVFGQLQRLSFSQEVWNSLELYINLMNREHLKTTSEDNSCKKQRTVHPLINCFILLLKNGKTGTNLLDKNSWQNYKSFRLLRYTAAFFLNLKECREVDEWISQWTAWTPIVKNKLCSTPPLFSPTPHVI